MYNCAYLVCDWLGVSFSHQAPLPTLCGIKTNTLRKQ